jgi:DNA helicase IV
MQKNKEELLSRLRGHIATVQGKVQEKLVEVQKVTKQSRAELLKIFRGDDEMAYIHLTNAQNKETELTHLQGSPYFMKCKITDEQGKEKDYYFSKHEFMEQSIYSWVAPMAILRFENPGPVSYRLPNGVKRQVKIDEKEQYLIMDGKVNFFAIETEGQPRELIYQEHFTRHKTEFALPEIVAQMEKAQDQVIRAHYKGPLAIAGPAGSGKTTLALHRVAYLTQAPDTAEHYRYKNAMVLVQDDRTRDYFSSLLPSLGIKDVLITTFSTWALKILGLEDHTYIEKYGDTEEEKSWYEYEKMRALNGQESTAWNKNIYSVLNKQYEKMSSENQKLFARQKKEKKLDRFDLTILLKAYLEKHEHFEIKREYQKFVGDNLVKRTERKVVNYSLLVIDEFQNYLPDQLKIFNRCLDSETESLIYVGDIAQQVKIGTIKNWDEVGAKISTDRNIRLHKVYRNTKNILRFIRDLGYTIEIPEQLKEGVPVTERQTKSVQEEISHIKECLKKYTDESIGILAKDHSYLEEFEKEFVENKNVHCLSILESQGVEFDRVFIVGLNKKYFEIDSRSNSADDYLTERKRIQKDLIYVGLTRAISELQLLGTDKVEDLLRM